MRKYFPILLLACAAWIQAAVALNGVSRTIKADTDGKFKADTDGK